MADPEFTAADFHQVVQKQIVNAVFETMAADKLEWSLVAPFLDAAHRICGADFREAASIRLHSVRAEGEDWVEAEEAFLGIAVADREDGRSWLSETYWLSDIILADRDDPAQLRRTLAAVERSLAKVRDFLAAAEAGGGGESSLPPAESA